ncbi:MAG TPA: hypothetical protein VM582_04970, partial [Candidatus Thermoplasmatota archaeon]|nr:hypothetical protein [Candidatus Thermoplasmatota archaeon]
LGELVAADMRHPAVLDVPEGYDHVIVSAGGTTGGRVRLDGPGGASWSTEFDGAEAWRHAMLPATPGKWTGIAAGRPFVPEAPPLPADAPLGWSYMHVAPVRWLRG